MARDGRADRMTDGHGENDIPPTSAGDNKPRNVSSCEISRGKLLNESLSAFVSFSCLHFPRAIRIAVAWWASLHVDASDLFISHPLDKNIPFYRYPGLLSQPRL